MNSNKVEIKNIIQRLKKSSGCVSVICPVGSGVAYYLSAIQRSLSCPMLIVVPDQGTAVPCCKDMKFFLAEPGHAMLSDSSRTSEPPLRHETTGPVILFPDLNPKDTSLKEFKAQMSASLYALTTHHCPISVIPASFLVTRQVSRSRLDTGKNILKTGDVIDVNGLIQSLPGMGYDPVPRVESEGEFSFRGGIMDIYVPVYNLPVRFELFGDEIVSIREFDPLTQRSIKCDFRS